MNDEVRERHLGARKNFVVAASIAVIMVGQSGEAPAAARGARTPISWAAVTQSDLAAMHRIIDANYIYATYPSRPTFMRNLKRADVRETVAAASVKDFAGYRATLLRYVADLADPHLLLRFNLKAATYRWPGFAAHAEGSVYRVTYSELPEAPVGASVESCDGKSVNAWDDGLLAVETGLQGKAGPRANMAPWIFVDQTNPYFHPPQTCVIGGRTLKLHWQTIPADQLAHKTGLGLPIDMPLGLTSFGDGGAWVRLPAMDPDTVEEAATWRDIIARMSSLRNGKAIVFDVRSNTGGSYEWFMAVLRSLYGDEYVRHYARARLQIRPVFVGRVPDDTATATQEATAPDPLAAPADTALNSAVSKFHYQITREGRTVTALDPSSLSDREAPPGSPPPSLLRAKVYVLADSGCASACVSFIDEMKSIPGVTLVGEPTRVDMRSGSPAQFSLPSGLVRMNVPAMVREGRSRGENVGYLPDKAFDGDIAATAEIQRWIAGLP